MYSMPVEMGRCEGPAAQADLELFAIGGRPGRAAAAEHRDRTGRKGAMGLMDLIQEPAVLLRLSPGWRLGRSSSGTSLVASNPEGREFLLADYEAHYEETNRRLGAGASLVALRDCVAAAAGARRAVAYLDLLQEWCRYRLIEFPLVDTDGEKAVLVPQWSDYVPALASQVPPAGRRLHRFASLRDDGGAWLLESPLCGVRLRLPSLAALKEPLVRRALAAGGFLQGEGPPQTRERRDALAQWEFHDLLFHIRHRGGWHRDPVGAAFPFVRRIDPTPAERPAWSGDAIDLPPAAADAEESFARLLERRRSERRYDETRPISLGDLGALLDRCARIRSIESRVAIAGTTSVSPEAVRRPYPSAGASYELEIYPIVDRCDGLDSGAYHYDAGRHRLVRIAVRTPEVEGMLADAKRKTGGLADPQILLAIAARFGRVMWKYRSISYGLILRNTGALYQTLYLAAADLGLSPCAVGSGDSALFARLTGLDPVVEGTVGEFILGGRPHRDDRQD